MARHWYGKHATNVKPVHHCSCQPLRQLKTWTLGSEWRSAAVKRSDGQGAVWTRVPRVRWSACMVLIARLTVLSITRANLASDTAGALVALVIGSSLAWSWVTSWHLSFLTLLWWTDWGFPVGRQDWLWCWSHVVVSARMEPPPGCGIS